MAWSKESQINRDLKAVPPEAEYAGWFDMDIEFRRPNPGPFVIFSSLGRVARA
jgi:hypothetical protein